MMESPDLFSQKMSREEVFTGLGGSILAHVLVFSVAFFAPLGMSRQSVQMPFAVDLVSLQDIGTGAVHPKLGKPAAKGAAAIKSQPSEKPASRANSTKSVVPVKRLQMDEPRTKPAELKKIDTPNAPKLPDPGPSTASVEKSLDKLIARPKAPPKPTPIAQADDDNESELFPGSHQASVSKPSKTKEGPAGNSEGTAKGREGPVGSSEGTAKGRSESAVKGTDDASPVGSPSGAQVALARRTYYTSIFNAIRQHWAIPDFLKSQQLEAVLVVVVRRDGKIESMQFEKRSGQPLFDASVERAVRKADPLPPFPEAYAPPKEEMALRFRPQDLA